MLLAGKGCYSPLFPRGDACDSRVCSTLCVTTLYLWINARSVGREIGL